MVPFFFFFFFLSLSPKTKGGSKKRKRKQQEKTHHSRLQVVADPDRQHVGRRRDHAPYLRNAQPELREKLDLWSDLLLPVVGQDDRPPSRDARQGRLPHPEPARGLGRGEKGDGGLEVPVERGGQQRARLRREDRAELRRVGEAGLFFQEGDFGADLEFFCGGGGG